MERYVRHGMPSGKNAPHSATPKVVHWKLVSTEASLEYLAERNMDVGDVADVVFGSRGTPRVRKGKRPKGTLVCDCSFCWRRVSHLCVTRSDSSLSCCRRRIHIASKRNSGGTWTFQAVDAFTVSARSPDTGEIRSYRSWLHRKGGQ